MSTTDSDYGFYGKTGVFTALPVLPIKRCCPRGPVLHTEYDSTVGFRETTYVLRCDRCHRKTMLTSVLDDLITEWNQLGEME